MEYIGKRISIQRKENELSIVILSFKDKLKNKMLLIWAALWSLSGIVIASQYFTITDHDTKTAIIVWLGFWAYFEYKIVVAYKWRTSGSEKLRISKEMLFYKRSLGKGGKIKEYKIDLIKQLKIIETKENSFFENLNDSYWMMGNETISFDYNGADIKLGIQLDAADAKALLKLIKNKL